MALLLAVFLFLKTGMATMHHTRQRIDKIYHGREHPLLAQNAGEER